MAGESNADHPSSPPTGTQSEPHATVHKDELAAGLPLQEREQPDPALQLSTGRLSPLSTALWAILIAVIIGVVWYGLTRPASEHSTAPAVASSSSPSSSPSTTAPSGNPAAPAKPAAPPSTTNGQPTNGQPANGQH